MSDKCPKTIDINGGIYQKVETTPETAPYEIGKCYLIRTVTNFSVGRLTFVGPQELVLEDGSWVADTGRFGECLKAGTLSETEKYQSDAIIGRGSLVDVQEWKHDLPNVSK